MKVSVKLYFQIFLVSLLLIVEISCTGGTAEQHWILAEKLFHTGKHTEAIKQFRKAVEADPKSQVGQKALLRIAEIQATNLNQSEKAIKSYRQFIGRSTDRDLVITAQRKLAEILFNRLSNYKDSLIAYGKLYEYVPALEDRDFFLLRMGKSQYHLLSFTNALESFNKIKTEYPNSNFIQEAIYESGKVLYMMGKYDDAIKEYTNLIINHPSTPFKIKAEFGIASSYEEMDELDKAYILFKNLQETYPNKKVIQTKMKHVLKRKISSKR